MKKTHLIFYWIFTGLLSVLMTTSAIRYLLDLEKFQQYFIDFGYNERIVLPLAIAKLLAVIVILSNKSYILKEWAYAALFFNFLLALEAHISIKDDLYFGPIIALALLAISYLFYRKVYFRNISKLIK